MKVVRLLWLAPVLCTTVFAAPRTFVSASSGLDTNPCTRPAPCRSFAAAFSVTDADGEVIAVDSGGYGVVMVTQGVSLIAPDGVYAGISASGSVGVIVNAGTANVVLRNLVINFGTESGIRVNSVGHLFVSKCSISGVQGAGILADSIPFVTVDVSDTIVRSCLVGVELFRARATLDGLTLINNTNIGAVFENSQVFVRNTVISGGEEGLKSSTSASVVVEDTSVTSADYGIYALGGAVLITRCALSANGTGIVSSGGTASVVDSVISANTTGIFAFNGGSILSRGNNTLYANTTDGTFNSTFAAQ
jgi:hypothetical protein